MESRTLGWLVCLGALLLIGAAVLVVRWAGRRGETSPAGLLPIPRRGHYQLLATLFLLLAVYGSLVPLNFKPMSTEEAIEQVRHFLDRPLSTVSRVDWAANWLLMVPPGFFGIASLTVDRPGKARRLLAAVAVLAVCWSSSIAIEAAQLYLPGRVASIHDVLAQALGAAAGCGLGLMLSQWLTEAVRRFTVTRRRAAYLDLLLYLYGAALLFYSLLPLNIIRSPSELAAKFRNGQVQLVPFAGMHWDWQGVFDFAVDLLLFFPIGVLATVAGTSAVRPVRSLLAAICWGVAYAVAIETLQILVVDRFSSATDVVAATLGVTLGAWWSRKYGAKRLDAHRLGGENNDWTSGTSQGGRDQTAWLLIAAALYVGLMFVVFCWPLQIDVKSVDLRARFDGFFRAPMAALQRGSIMNAVTQLLRKPLFFAPLGLIVAKVVGNVSHRGTVARPIVVATAIGLFVLVGLAIEMLQIVQPNHVPDLTDVVLYSSGATVGMIVALRLLDSR